MQPETAWTFCWSDISYWQWPSNILFNVGRICKAWHTGYWNAGHPSRWTAPTWVSLSSSSIHLHGQSRESHSVNRKKTYSWLYRFACRARRLRVGNVWREKTPQKCMKKLKFLSLSAVPTTESWTVLFDKILCTLYYPLSLPRVCKRYRGCYSDKKIELLGRQIDFPSQNVRHVGQHFPGGSSHL